MDRPDQATVTRNTLLPDKEPLQGNLCLCALRHGKEVQEACCMAVRCKLPAVLAVTWGTRGTGLQSSVKVPTAQ